MDSGGAIMSKGLLITLEGPDGSGKTTQIALLKEYLTAKGYKILNTREPGGTQISEKIRDIILDNDNKNMSYMCEALLYAASRAQLVEEVIKPALNEGTIVICDRFVESSIVYQGIGRGLGKDRVRMINEAAVDGLKPDVTFMLTIPYDEGLRRKENQRTLDRLENSGDEFHKKVFMAYAELANSSEIIQIIDADRGIDEIHRDIVKRIEEKLKNH